MKPQTKKTDLVRNTAEIVAPPCRRRQGGRNPTRRGGVLRAKRGGMAVAAPAASPGSQVPSQCPCHAAPAAPAVCGDVQLAAQQGQTAFKALQDHWLACWQGHSDVWPEVSCPYQDGPARLAYFASYEQAVLSANRQLASEYRRQCRGC